jgi:hypothetical protein
MATAVVGETLERLQHSMLPNSESRKPEDQNINMLRNNGNKTALRIVAPLAVLPQCLEVSFYQL